MAVLKTLVTLGLAASATAFNSNGEHVRREVLLEARKAPTTAASVTGTSTSAAAAATTDSCSSALQGLATLFSGIPRPTGELSSYLNSAATTLTDPCHLTIPSSIASTFSVYESSVISFYQAHSSELNSALSVCTSLTKLVNNPVCSTTTSTASVAVSTTTTTPSSSGAIGSATGSGSSSGGAGGSSATGSSTGAASTTTKAAGSGAGALQTSVVGAMLVAAGIVALAL